MYWKPIRKEDGEWAEIKNDGATLEFGSHSCPPGSPGYHHVNDDWIRWLIRQSDIAIIVLHDGGGVWLPDSSAFTEVYEHGELKGASYTCRRKYEQKAARQGMGKISHETGGDEETYLFFKDLSHGVELVKIAIENHDKETPFIPEAISPRARRLYGTQIDFGLAKGIMPSRR